MKRLFDIVSSFLGLIIFSPILLPVIILVWLQDYHFPFFIASRVGKDGQEFNMIKLRSMIVNADKNKVDSTSVNDLRITAIGFFIRKYKLDEITQLWNVLKGDMSLVGPRPNVKRETNLYTLVEQGLLKVKPGITDFSSIVFSDEGEILKDRKDPDLAYNQLIRPWKSRLGLLYVNNMSFIMDIKLIFLTIIAIFSREIALSGIAMLLDEIDSPCEIKKISRRKEKLIPFPPPGADTVVTCR